MTSIGDLRSVRDTVLDQVGARQRAIVAINAELTLLHWRETIRHDLQSLRDEGRPSPALLLKDPYILNFLGLNDRYLEKGLEDAILREIEHFLLELGVGFTFIARQKRLQIDNDDFFIDLLFYNRKLKHLVALELKVGEFRAEHWWVGDRRCFPEEG